MRTLLLSLLAVACSFTAAAQFSLDLESGIAAFGYNDVRISGSNGSDFSLTDDFSSSPKPFFRARAQYTFGERHSVSALYAPLSITSKGSFQDPVRFQDDVFLPGTETSVKWKFNSYRITYQYSFLKREKLTLAAGLTGKVRDAEIEVTNNFGQTSKTNVGFVPLIRFYGDWNFAGNYHLILDGDALASKQGRAEDILLAVTYDPSDRIRIKLGYRMLEGGADNDEVYNFSMVNYASAGIVATFR